MRVFLVLMMCWVATANADWQASSGPQRALMIELYTSQGCSSCPPAEEWLNRFAGHAELWRSFIPLALHVDYWDYIGWKDRFALPGNSQRQRRYASLGHVRGVYTPGFLVNGRGWRPGLFGSLPAEAGGDAGVLTLNLDDNGLQVAYRNGGDTGPLELHLAVLGMGLQSDIAAGENEGRHSRHEFVVLWHRRLASPGPHWNTEAPAMADKGETRRALVAWVSRPGDPTPLQAAGGYLPR